MSWKKVKLKKILKQYRIELQVQNDIEYKQVTISKYDGVTFRGSKMGREIGRKRQFQIDLKKFPNTLMFVRQGVQDGSIGIAPLEVDGCIVTENMPMFSIEGINLEYLKFLLKSPYFHEELNKIQTTGSAQKSIHEREILEIEIPFPDIEKQEDIVLQLSRKKNISLEICLELTHQLTLVKKLRQQLLQDALQGKLVEQNPKDEPASELLKKIKAEKQKLIAEKKLKKEKELPPIKPEEIPFEIPENWVWCRLGEIGLNLDGKRIPLSMSERSRRQGSYDYYGAQGVIDYIDDFKFDGTYLLIAEDGQNLIRKNKEVAFIASGKFWVNNHAHVNDFFNSSTREFTKCYINSISLKPYISGKPPSQIKLKRSQFDLIPVPLPPITEQTRIVKKLDELMRYCNELEVSIKQSEAQNEKLLQQVLREALRKEPVGV